MNGEDLHMSDCLKTDSHVMFPQCIKAAWFGSDGKRLQLYMPLLLQSVLTNHSPLITTNYTFSWLHQKDLSWCCSVSFLVSMINSQSKMRINSKVVSFEFLFWNLVILFIFIFLCNRLSWWGELRNRCRRKVDVSFHLYIFLVLLTRTQ